MKTILFRTSLVGRWKLYLLALGLLGATSNVFGQGPTFTTIDFPGAAFPFPSGINPQGDISGNCCTLASGYLLSDGDFTSWGIAGATFTNTTGLNARGDIVGRYVAGGTSHGYLLIASQF